MAAGRVASDTENVMRRRPHVVSALCAEFHVMDMDQNPRGTKTLYNSTRKWSNLKRQFNVVDAITEDQASTLARSRLRLIPAYQQRGASYLKEREAELLMYYLDHTFHLSYQYYQDDPSSGGRGWLLWLLSVDGPMRQAVLTLSALQQHIMFQSKGNSTETELIRYHGKAMEGLRQVLKCELVDKLSKSLEERIKFIACGVILISLQVFQGGETDWRLHLDAITSLVQDLSPLSLDSWMRSEFGAQTVRNRSMTAALKFLLSGVLHFDLLSSVSMGIPPRLNYKEWLNCGFVDMANVVGCANWAMEIIGDIATLETLGPSPDSEYRLNNVEQRLDQAVSGSPTSNSTALVKQITRVYATAAVIQLQVSRQKSDSCQDAGLYHQVQNVIDALQQIPPSTSLRGLPWPICVAGCFAQHTQREFFRALIQNVPDGGSKFSNFVTVSRIMEYAWRRFDEGAASRSIGYMMREMGLEALLV